MLSFGTFELLRFRGNLKCFKKLNVVSFSTLFNYSWFQVEIVKINVVLLELPINFSQFLKRMWFRRLQTCSPCTVYTFEPFRVRLYFWNSKVSNSIRSDVHCSNNVPCSYSVCFIVDESLLEIWERILNFCFCKCLLCVHKCSWLVEEWINVCRNVIFVKSSIYRNWLRIIYFIQYENIFRILQYFSITFLNFILLYVFHAV